MNAHGQPKTQGRTQLVEPGYILDRNCHLFSAAPTKAASTKDYEPTAVTAPPKAGQDCGYTTDAAYGSDATAMWATYANDPDTCCKACAASKGCVAATYLARPGKKDETEEDAARRRLQPEPSEGFGLHLVDVWNSSTAGGLGIAAVEAHFTDKFGDGSEFDPFFDFNIQLYSTDLPAYVEAFAAGGVKTLPATWKAVDGDTWYSLFVHVPSSQMILEMVSKNWTGAAPALALETRMSNRTATRMGAVAKTYNNLLYGTAVSRAVSDLAVVTEFYTKVLGAVAVLDVEDKGAKRKCFQWGWAESDICFVERADASKFNVKAMEDNAWAVHATYDKNPTMDDKYADNHYAIDLMSVSAKPIVDTFTANYKSIYPIANRTTSYAFSCEQDYIIDPTGWSIQTDLNFRGLVYPGCGNYHPKVEIMYN